MEAGRSRSFQVRTPFRLLLVPLLSLFEHFSFDSHPLLSHYNPQKLQGQACERFARIAELSFYWYRTQYEALDAMVEALREDNDWLEYNLMGVEDAYTDQRTLAAQKTKEAKDTKAAL
jgi:hypothetical protein